MGGLAIRVGGVALGLLLLGGIWYAYKESLRSEGRQEIRDEHTQAVQEQQAVVRTVEAAQYDALLEVVDRTAQESKTFHMNLLQSKRQLSEKEREVARLKRALETTPPQIEVQYVEVEKPAPCLVPADVTARVDELAGVLNAIPYDRVSGDVGADPDAAVSGSAPATCAQLVGRLEALTARLGDSLIAHRGLTEYVQQERAINRSFHTHYQESRHE